MPRGGARPGAGRPRKKPIGADSPPKPKAARATAKPSTAKPKSLDDAIQQAKDLTLRLMSELDAVTTHHGELEDLIIDETAGDRDAKRRNAMLRAIELPSRSATLKVLISATRAWADLERAAQPKPLVPGKKAAAQVAAETAGQGTEWGSDLDIPPARPN